MNSIQPQKPHSYVSIKARGYRSSKEVDVLIDATDLPLISAYKWRINRYGYAFTTIWENGKTITLYIHKLVMPAQGEMFVDHINIIKTDNRRENLRYVNRQQNAVNRKPLSGFKGVSFHRRCGKWQAQLKVNGKNRYLGLFNSETEAALAYDYASFAEHGEYAYLNFPGVVRGHA